MIKTCIALIRVILNLHKVLSIINELQKNPHRIAITQPRVHSEIIQFAVISIYSLLSNSDSAIT